MNHNFPGGVWPVMLTPFTEQNEIDFKGLEELTEWYIRNGCNGLFAVTQSSEMFFLTLEERVKIAEFVCKKVNGRVPVIVSGHTADDADEQLKEIMRMAETGADAVILVTNRIAKEDEGEDVWISNLKQLTEKIPRHIKLGLYECPYPYKRVMSQRMTEWCVQSERFYFLKDTSCDLENIRMKLAVCRGSNLKLYNANTATLLESLRCGASGYSGVMANMQCRLYEKLTCDFKEKKMEELLEELTMCALIEKQWYPTNAKYYLGREGLHITTKCRVQDDKKMTQNWKDEMHMLKHITERLEQRFL